MMKPFALTAVAWLIFCLTSAVTAQPAATDKASGEDLKSQAAEMLDTAQKYTEQQKAEFQKKMELDLQILSKRFETLKQKAEASKGEALAVLEKKIADLRAQQTDAEQKLAELKSAGARAWEDAKIKVEHAVDNLKKTYDHLLNK